MKLNNVRLSYVNVFKAKAMQEGQDPKYSCQIIIPKTHPQLRELEEEIIRVAKEKFPKVVTGNAFPARLKNPLRDGDAERDDEIDTYGDCYFFNANNNKRPLVINKDKTLLTEEDNVIYSGCFANVVVDLFGYDTAGNKGVAVSLGGVQFKADGGALGGRGTTTDDFDDEEDYDI